MTIGWNEENIGKEENHSAALKWTPTERDTKANPQRDLHCFPQIKP